MDLSESIYSVLHVEEAEAEVARRNLSRKDVKKGSKGKDNQTSNKQQTLSSGKETLVDYHFHSIEDEKTAGGGIESPDNIIEQKKTTSQETTCLRECSSTNYECDNVKAKRANLVLLGSSFSGRLMLPSSNSTQTKTKASVSNVLHDVTVQSPCTTWMVKFRHPSRQWRSESKRSDIDIRIIDYCSLIDTTRIIKYFNY